MSAFTLTVTTEQPFATAVDATRAALADQGFGIISEIDLAGALKEKIGADVAPQVILGACRPHLAHLAIVAEPAIATVLPCNVVVRALDDETCVIEAFDPAVMTRISEDETLGRVAADARARLIAALATLGTPIHDPQED